MSRSVPYIFNKTSYLNEEVNCPEPSLPLSKYSLVREINIIWTIKREREREREKERGRGETEKGGHGTNKSKKE